MNFTSWTPKFVRVWFVSVHTDFISRKYMNTHDRDGSFQGVLTVAAEQPCGVQVVEGVGLVKIISFNIQAAPRLNIQKTTTSPYRKKG